MRPCNRASIGASSAGYSASPRTAACLFERPLPRRGIEKALRALGSGPTEERAVRAELSPLRAVGKLLPSVRAVSWLRPVASCCEELCCRLGRKRPVSLGTVGPALGAPSLSVGTNGMR